MAVHFNARIYGEVEGSAPFQNGDGRTAFSREVAWPASQIVNFNTANTNIFPLPNGQFIGGMYVYSVIEVAPTGLNVHGKKYVSDSSAASLATSIG